MPRQSASTLAYPSAKTRISPPDDLPAGSPERALFVDLVLNAPPDQFQNTDAPLLAAYCRAAIQEQTASSELAAAGYVGIDGRPSGWLPILQAATRTMSTFSRMLRLNPAGRAMSTPAKSADDAVPVSYYERMEMTSSKAFRDEPN